MLHVFRTDYLLHTIYSHLWNKIQNNVQTLRTIFICFYALNPPENDLLIVKWRLRIPAIYSDLWQINRYKSTLIIKSTIILGSETMRNQDDLG